MGSAIKVPKFILLLLIVSLMVKLSISGEIKEENVEITLNGMADVSVTLNYKEITTSKLSYLIPYKISYWKVYDENRTLKCNVLSFRIGTEFQCIPNKKENYTVHLEYVTDEIVVKKEDFFKFEYQHKIVEPVDSYYLKVILPEGYGILKTNASISPIEPEADNIGSTGRRIFVEWRDNEVKLGSTLSYSILYEDLGLLRKIPYEAVIAILSLLLILIIISLILKRKKRTIEEVFPVLKDDERKIVEFIRDKGGKCRQREIVRELNLSKAKASRIIKDLEERNIVEKIKRGRNNIIILKESS